MNFQPDLSQQKALKTWYSKDDPLYLDHRHPSIKLAGEAGELLDLYGKEEYKPGFSWWDCKHCQKSENGHIGGLICYHDRKLTYTPLVLDELGDYSYYLRILACQKAVTFEVLCSEFEKYLDYYIKDDLLKLLTSLMNSSDTVLSDFVFDEVIELGHLKYCAYFFLAILYKLNCTLDQLTDLNCKKLNSEPTAHGWKNSPPAG